MRAVLMFAFLALAGCQTPCPAPQTGASTVIYRCDDGSDLRVTFSEGAGSARIEQEGYTTSELPMHITDSGYRFAAEGAELRGRGAQAYWTRPGAAETLCREVR